MSFKVICIDAKPRSYTCGGMDIFEGDIYEVDGNDIATVCRLPMYYLVGHYECNNHGQRIGYAMDRFIPLSNIDELQLTNSKYELV